MMTVAEETIGKRKKKTSKWMCDGIPKEAKKRRKLKATEIRVEKVIYKELNPKIQRMMRIDKERIIQEQ